MYSIYHILKKILFPQSCLGCGNAGSAFCQACLTQIPLKPRLLHTKSHIEIHIFPYVHKKISKIIWELKYKNNTELRAIICKHIGEDIQDLLKQHMGPANGLVSIVSVPKTSYVQLRKRDFDHGLLLVRALIPYLQSYTVTVLTDVLIKKNSIRQASLKNRSERIKAMRGSIVPSPSFRNSKPVRTPLIIIDDVTTTGATRDEMIKVLKPYFLGPIVFIALAH